jgi:hypothetical protein
MEVSDRFLAKNVIKKYKNANEEKTYDINTLPLINHVSSRISTLVNSRRTIFDVTRAMALVQNYHKVRNNMRHSNNYSCT